MMIKHNFNNENSMYNTSDCLCNTAPPCKPPTSISKKQNSKIKTEKSKFEFINKYKKKYRDLLEPILLIILGCIVPIMISKVMTDHLVYNYMDYVTLLVVSILIFGSSILLSGILFRVFCRWLDN